MNSAELFRTELKLWASLPEVKGKKDEAVTRIMEAFEKNASKLDLGCLMLGQLPSCLGQLKKLVWLDVKGNDLTTLPTELGDLPELQVLDVCYNSDLAILPRTLGKISNLYIATGSTGISKQTLDAISDQSRSCVVQEKMVVEKGKFDREKLLFSQRPQKVQERIDQVFNELQARERLQPNHWMHKGTNGFYGILGFDDGEVIAQRIRKAAPGKKDLYFIDLGAGNFAWVDEAASYLKNNFSEDSHHFHVIGVTGEGELYNHKEEKGNITTYKINGFKLENLLESFENPAIGLNLINSVEFMASSWTLRHLVDPLGTLEQAYHLLTCGNGYLFGTGFVGTPYGIDRKEVMSSTLSRAFGMHSYIAGRHDSQPDSFALFRSAESTSTFAKNNFRYDLNEPLFETGERVDCFAKCHANIIPSNREFSVDIDFGGHFHGSGTYVLEQLLGKGTVKVDWGNYCYDYPLFDIGYGFEFLKRYLDTHPKLAPSE